MKPVRIESDDGIVRLLHDDTIFTAYTTDIAWLVVADGIVATDDETAVIGRWTGPDAKDRALAALAQIEAALGGEAVEQSAIDEEANRAYERYRLTKQHADELAKMNTRLGELVVERDDAREERDVALRARDEAREGWNVSNREVDRLRGWLDNIRLHNLSLSASEDAASALRGAPVPAAPKCDPAAREPDGHRNLGESDWGLPIINQAMQPSSEAALAHQANAILMRENSEQRATIDELRREIHEQRGTIASLRAMVAEMAQILDKMPWCSMSSPAVRTRINLWLAAAARVAKEAQANG